jgi:hypothetical protein
MQRGDAQAGKLTCLSFEVDRLLCKVASYADVGQLLKVKAIISVVLLDCLG